MVKDKNLKNNDEIKKKKKKKKKVGLEKPIKEKKESAVAKLLGKFIDLFKKKDKKKPSEQEKSNKNVAVDNKKDDEKSKDDNFVDDLFKDFDEEDKEETPRKSKKKKYEEDEDKSDDKVNDEDEDENEDEEDEQDEKSKKLLEKFSTKDGIKKPRSLKEIAEESKKKADDLKNQKFIETDAAKGDVKKTEEGYNAVVKKDVTKKSLKGKIFLIRGKDNGRPAWHYILVPHENIKALKRQKAGSNIDVTDYGRIVRSGWGENPSDEIVKEIEAEYGD